MKLHLTWPVSVVTAALVLAGCSTSDAGSTDREQRLELRRRPPRRPPRASPELQKAADDYKGYAVGQADELVRVVKVLTDAVRAGDLKAAQDAYAPSRHAVGAHRADRRTRRGHRCQDRLPRRRLRERRRSEVHRLAPARVPAVREEHHRGRRTVRRPARQGHRRAEGPAAVGRGRSRSTWRTARPNSSKRCRRASSPARRIATPRPTCGTSTRNLQGSQVAIDKLSPALRKGRRRPAGQDHPPVSPRSSTPCGRCARVMAGCSSAPKTVSTRRRGARR